MDGQIETVGMGAIPYFQEPIGQQGETCTRNWVSPTALAYRDGKTKAFHCSRVYLAHGFQGEP